MSGVAGWSLVIDAAMGPADATESERVGRHAAARLAAEILGRLLQFVLVYTAQRQLGPAKYGELTWALSIGVVLTALTDLGLQLIVTRRIARDRASASSVAGVALAARLCAAAVGAAAIVMLAWTRAPFARPAAALIGLALVAASFVEFAGYVLRGLQRADREALLLLAMRVLTVALGLGVLARGGSLTGLAAAYFAAALLSVAVAIAVTTRSGVTPVPVLDRPALAALLREALPLGGAIVVSMAYTRTAVFLLDAVEGATSVGMYGVAQKLIEPLAIVPAALLASAFPAFTSRRAAGRHQDAARLGRRTVGLLATSGAVIALIGSLGAERAIGLLYGAQYADAAPVLRWLSLGVFLSFINYALTHGLIALDRQRDNLRLAIAVFVLNLVLCVVLIPRHGASGGAMAALASESALFVLCLWCLRADRARRPV